MPPIVAVASFPVTPDLLRSNQLLALLDEGTLAALVPAMRWQPLDLRHTLARAGQPIRHAWFPASGVMSVVASFDDGSRTVEVATVGQEGMVGLPLVLGSSRAPHEVFAQVPGDGWRIDAADFLRAVDDHPSLARVLLRYSQALMRQMAQSTACNRAHTALQRCARWLLMTHDRCGDDTFHLTQQFLGEMLGERRPTVSQAASDLRRRRLITYTRGRIAVLDRHGLEEAACPCYRIVRDAYDQLLRPPR